MKKIPIEPEILKKIKHIEICTRRLLKGTLVGDHAVVQKGFGLEFDQIREYQSGDDIRFIDWKSSARTGKLLVKQYYQEQSRTIWLLVDISSSVQFASKEVSKRDIIAQIASALSIIADVGKDFVGLILFSNDIEYCLPPKRGKSHIYEIMKQVFFHQSLQRKTDIQKVCKFLMEKRSKDAIVFLISDFIDEGYEKCFPFLASWFDLIAIRCLDSIEKNFPLIGGLYIEDIETGDVCELDIYDQKNLATIVTAHINHQNKIFKKYGIDYLDIDPIQPFINNLIHFFQKRMRY